MTTETMTIHKALSELKTLDARIEKALRETTFVTSCPQSAQKVNGASRAEFAAAAKSGYQKVRDLIARRNALKRAVVLSNATTRVVVAGQEYTVAEAIEMKNHGVQYTKALMNRLSTDLSAATTAANRANGDSLTSRADAYISALFSSAELKNPSAEVMDARQKYIDAQTVALVDPLNVRVILEELEAQVNDFLVDVDAALSVSNATTTVEICY